MERWWPARRDGLKNFTTKNPNKIEKHFFFKKNSHTADERNREGVSVDELGALMIACRKTMRGGNGGGEDNWGGRQRWKQGAFHTGEEMFGSQALPPRNKKIERPLPPPATLHPQPLVNKTLKEFDLLMTQGSWKHKRAVWLIIQSIIHSRGE